MFVGDIVVYKLGIFVFFGLGFMVLLKFMVRVSVWFLIGVLGKVLGGRDILVRFEVVLVRGD